jgi:hypothetical protein
MSVSLQQPMRPAEIALVELANTNETAIAQEIADRIAADTTLQNNIDAEETARKAADTTLQANIDAEETARKAADTTLQANIDAEASARKAADTTLQSGITAEATAREQADMVLTSSLNDEIAARQELDTTVTNLETQLNQTNTNLETEVTNRTTADSKLQASIDEVNGKFPVTTDNIADNAITSDKIADGTINIIDLNTGIQNQLSFLASLPDLEFGTSNSFDVSASSYYDCTVTFTAKTETPIVLCGLQHTTGNMAYIVTDVTNQQFNARVFNLTTADITGVTLDWLTISGR